MKTFLLATIAAGAIAAAAAPADAAQGCGPGFHRGPYGRCRPNGPGYGPGPALVIGNFYQGRGYWDGRRYYQHRDAYRGGYRYR